MAISDTQFTTKDGRRIDMTWIEPEPNPKIDTTIWVVHRIEASIEGQEVGYLKIRYIPKERWKRLFPTVVHFASKILSLRVDPNAPIDVLWKQWQQ